MTTERQPPAEDRRQVILDAALGLADEKGLDAVSMRAVAQRAGLTAMALYPHVGSKSELLDAMVGRLLWQMLPDATGGTDATDGTGGAGDPDCVDGASAGARTGWQERLRGLAHAARNLAHDHPWAAALLFSRPAVTPDAARTVDQIYTALLDAGVPEPEVPRLERLLSTMVLGYAASEVGGRFGSRIDPAARRTLLEGQTAPGHARLARWLGQPVDWDAEFEADLSDLLRIIHSMAR
jgi:AcrR family transcriptional regulator